MSIYPARHKVRRWTMVTASSAFAVGLALLNGGGAQSIGGLCNGRPASHTWLDASGQYGPALLRRGRRRLRRLPLRRRRRAVQLRILTIDGPAPAATPGPAG